MKPAKRGKQRVGGEALFALHYFTFNYQQCHANNCFISQLRWYCAIIPMDEFRNINALIAQYRRYYTIIPMNVFGNINAFMVQLGTSCSSDSPGLARNEPTPGEHPQGDSTL